jgi:hypothetical protein
MKEIFKLIGGLLIGIAAGLLIAGLILLICTDITIPQYIDKLASIEAMETGMLAFGGALVFMLSLAIVIPAHEAGHLVAGLLTGYRFVSFRIFNLTLIRQNGKTRLKRFSIAGTGGQCLLTPPDLPLDKIPTGWYNAGGVLANLLLLILTTPLFLLPLHPLAKGALAIFCLTDAFVMLFNGIPLKINGMGNDGYNMLFLHRNPRSKHSLMIQLRSNALIQEGIRPKDMPDSWFVWEKDLDYSNPLEVALPMMYASRLIDEMRWEEAYEKFDELYSHRDKIMQLYVNEIAGELAFCAMVTGHAERAREILDPKLRKYIVAYRKMMSSKQRILCAEALYLDRDTEKAQEIYSTLESTKDKYLLQGEVESDLDIIRHFLATEERPAI